MAKEFDWVDFYKEFAGKLLEYKNKRNDLIEKVKKIFEMSNINLPKLERDNNIIDIDPFTVFGLFNKKITQNNRIKLLNAISEEFDIKAKVPLSFDGIPILSPLNSKYYGNSEKLAENDIQNLWELFDSALEYAANPDLENKKRVSTFFDLAVDIKNNAKSKITMGLYWIAPDFYINLDSCNTEFLYSSGEFPSDFVESLPKPKNKITSNDYFDLLEKIMGLIKNGNSEYNNLQELSYAAWLFSKKQDDLKVVDETSKIYGIHMTDRNTALSDDNPHICIGWSELGDLSEIADKKELENLYDENYPNDKGKAQDIAQLYAFSKEMKEGDLIVFSDKQKVHIGKITSDYIFDENEYEGQTANYKNAREVKWLKKNIDISQISNDLKKSLSIPRTIWSLNSHRDELLALLTDNKSVPSLKYKTGFFSPYKRNRIIFGAPGTGKSYILEKEKKELLGSYSEDNFERVTFHPEYSYANFVGTYKPTMAYSKNSSLEDEKVITYKFVPGPFMRVLVKALKSGMTDNPEPFVLVIEEINRANPAAVFGDIFQLLDRKENVSEYAISASEDMRSYLAEKLEVDESKIQSIQIPDNMFIWATMNSADQGVFPMDTAFKRRWNFTYLGIDAAEDSCEEKIKNRKYNLGNGEYAKSVTWNELRKAINDELSSSFYNINEDKLLGLYFIEEAILKNENDNEFIEAFKNKVLMYLFEDAVKQKRTTFFDKTKNAKGAIRYSDICRSFDEKGVFIFPDGISNVFNGVDE